MHKSVGAILKNDKRQILMIERKNFPFGWACPAGHVDQGETPKQAMIREVKEETNLNVLECKLLVHEFVPWNECSKGEKGHDWHVYEVIKYAGTVKRSVEEAKKIKWMEKRDLASLELEKVWKKWYKDLNIFK